MPISIRAATRVDRAAILAVHRQGFGRESEARLCARLMDEGALAVSLVAETGGAVIGHVAASAIELPEAPDPPRLLGLGPIAVAPARQSGGVGSALMRAVLAAARDAGWAGTVLLGDPAFYGRFGFRPASGFGLACAWDVPDEAFMAVELTPGALRAARGRALYHPAFEPD